MFCHDIFNVFSALQTAAVETHLSLQAAHEQEYQRAISSLLKAATFPQFQ